MRWFFLRSARFASVSSLRKTAYRKVGKQGFYIDRDFLSQEFEHDKGFHWKVVF